MYALIQICHVVVSPTFKIGISPKFFEILSFVQISRLALVQSFWEFRVVLSEVHSQILVDNLLYIQMWFYRLQVVAFVINTQCSKVSVFK